MGGPHSGETNARMEAEAKRNELVCRIIRGMNENVGYMFREFASLMILRTMR